MRRHHISGQFFRSKTSGQVLYLKAGKNFVDMLFSFLLLPIGTIIHLLSKGVPQEQHYHGAIINIFKSIMEKLDSELLHVDRGSILAPPTPAAKNPSDLIKAPALTGLPQLWQDANAAKRPSPPKKKFNLPGQFCMCRNCARLLSTKGARCFSCWPQNGPSIANCYFGQGPCSLSAEEVQRLHDSVAEQQSVEECICVTGVGFVKENITFMVTDKLEIMPSTTIEIMSVLKEMKVNTLTDFESEKITVTITQVLQLIGSALNSNSCLNEVFGTGETSIKSSTSGMHDATAKVRKFLISFDEQ